MFSDPLFYSDRTKVPMLNGLARGVTPPASRPVMLANQRIFEFLVPYPLLMVDRADWPNLRFQIESASVEVTKPIVAFGALEAAGRLGNEAPEAYCTILRVTTSDSKSPSSESLWSVVESALAWIRVRSRQYWLLHGSTGYGASFRGSILQNGSMSNFAGFGATILVRPFTKEMWLSIEGDLTHSDTPPVSESIFCDGLLSAVAGDETKALLELGVACEIELTQLLAAAANAGPSTPDKTDYLTNEGDWDPFKTKFKKWPQRLGLDDVASHPTAGIPSNWPDLVLELYRLRGGVAHSGKKKFSGASVQSYVFAANALFSYSLAQKTRLGLPHYALGANENPIDQVIGYRDNTLFVNGAQGP